MTFDDAVTATDTATAPDTGTARPSDLIVLGKIKRTVDFGISLPKLMADGRLLIQGTSGAGKSWLMRRLLEQSSGQVQHIIIDPEGEFRSLAESADYPVIDASKLDGNRFAALGVRVRSQRLSLVLDISQLDRERQLIAVAGFLRAIIDCPRENWHPAIVAIDEAHLFAPMGGQGFESATSRRVVTAAMVDLMSRGRKRGLAAIIATQRLARLSKSVASEATNFLVGRNTLDLDIRRAAEIIGWDARRAFDLMPGLTPGSFIASGGAFNQTAEITAIGSVRSRHIGASPDISAPPLPTAIDAASQLGIDDLEDEAEAEPLGLPPGFRAVRGFIGHPSAPLATRIVEALLPLYPSGAAIAELVTHFATTGDDLDNAIDLLTTWNTVTKDDGGAIRLERGMGARLC